METITVICISLRNAVQSECAQLLKQHPDIALLALTASPIECGERTVLSLSDVAVIDEGIIQCNGNEILATLQAVNPRLKFLLIMEGFHKNRMLWAIAHGVRGVILRCELQQLLGKAIRKIDEGEIWMPRNLLNSFRGLTGDEVVYALNTDVPATEGRLRLH